ncbi:MAG: adenosylmethionine decarboxylase [Bradymonadales bacterium]|nr:adenosylmethionine decarboxylase [Bradymonadales bacterium]
MDTLGRHLLVDYWGCDLNLLDNRAHIENLMIRAAEATGSTVVQSTFHTFSPQGVSGVVVIEESHLSIHTWPEAGYAAVDFFTCGDCEPRQAHEVFRKGLKCRTFDMCLFHRGLGPQSRSITIKDRMVTNCPRGEYSAVVGGQP